MLRLAGKAAAEGGDQFRKGEFGVFHGGSELGGEQDSHRVTVEFATQDLETVVVGFHKAEVFHTLVGVGDLRREGVARIETEPSIGAELRNPVFCEVSVCFHGVWRLVESCGLVDGATIARKEYALKKYFADFRKSLGSHAFRTEVFSSGYA